MSEMGEDGTISFYIRLSVLAGFVFYSGIWSYNVLLAHCGNSVDAYGKPASISTTRMCLSAVLADPWRTGQGLANQVHSDPTPCVAPVLEEGCMAKIIRQLDSGGQFS
jgi:hypothetical protein